MRRPILKFTDQATYIIAAVFLVLAGGCRHGDANRELVERELRLQEDELYRLHDEISAREKLIESARSENAVLKRELEQSRSGAAQPPGIAPEMPPAPSDAPPARTPRPGSGVPPGDLVPPTIEIPGLDNAPTRPPAGRSSWNSTRPVRRASFEEPANETADKPNDHPVAKIVLNRRLTGGYNADGRLGDEGVTVVIEPRGANDQLVKRGGDISIVVIDPALSGNAGRVARWDFSPDEIAQLIRKTPPGEGIRLELRWTAHPPAHERLMLFARFTTAEGERFEANQAILVDLARDAAVTSAPSDAH